MHTGRAFVINLHAIDADIALPCFRIARNHQRPGDEASRIFWPALQDRKIKQRKAVTLDHFLAGSGLDSLREERAQLGQLRQHFNFIEQPLRGLHVKKSANARRDFIDVVNIERKIHAAFAAKRIDQERHARALGTFEQQRRTTGSRHAIGDLRNFQNGIDFGGDAPQFALFFQLRNKFAQIPVSQTILQAHRDTLA